MTTTIDATPTWKHLVPVLMHIVRNAESQTTLRDITIELEKMAEAADKWNEHCKSQA